jgi:hypothetical protein
VWDLASPHLPRFSVDSRGIRDLKVADGALLLSLAGAGEGRLRLRVLDLVQGECVQVGAALDLRGQIAGRHVPWALHPGDAITVT